jgi:hypothetical protein
MERRQRRSFTGSIGRRPLPRRAWSMQPIGPPLRPRVSPIHGPVSEWLASRAALFQMQKEIMTNLLHPRC